MVRLTTKTYTRHRVGLDFIFDSKSRVIQQIIEHIDANNKPMNDTFEEYIKRLGSK